MKKRNIEMMNTALREIKEMTEPLTYYCDNYRHLVCLPYSIYHLHRMAANLGLKRKWFHAGKFPHYDIPINRIEEITSKCTVIRPRQIIEIIQTGNISDTKVTG